MQFLSSNNTCKLLFASQYVSTAIWNRFVAGLNAHLRTVNQRKIRTALGPVLSWISTHGNPQLERCGVRVDLGWFQATASGYYQLGIVVSVNEGFFTSLNSPEMPESSDRSRFIFYFLSFLAFLILNKQLWMCFVNHFCFWCLANIKRWNCVLCYSSLCAC